MVTEDDIPVSWIDGYQDYAAVNATASAITGAEIYDVMLESQMIPDQLNNQDYTWATPFGRYPANWEVAGGWGNAQTTIGKQGSFDAEALYTFDNETINVNDLLDDVFFIMTPNENPDGRSVNSRRNYNGFDLNRDGSFQTQAETQNLEPFVASWNPIIMDEYHGYTGPFLIEPCTPPHEQNMEYDLLVEQFLKGGEAFGNAAIASVQPDYPAAIGTGHNDPGEKGINFSRYWIPLRDGFAAARDGGLGDGTWYAWDDLSTSYGPSYAMINCGSLGYTVEIDFNVEGCVDLLVYGTFGHARFIRDNKVELLTNQLKFFERGVENEDVSDAEHALDNPLVDKDGAEYADAPLSFIETFYVDDDNNIFEDDLWRPKFTASGETGKYFPEFYVIPVDTAAQRDPADVKAITEYLIRNDVKLGKLNADTSIDGTTYKAGSVIVDMHQAKRDYANAILWKGIDASFYSGLYSESVVNFPQLRGFTTIPIAKESAYTALAGKVDSLGSELAVPSTLDGNTVDYTAVIIKNNGQEAVRAVNALLKAGKTVGLITTGSKKGNFIVDKATYNDAKGTYTLIGTGVKKADGDVYKITEPTVYIAGYQPGEYGTYNPNPYWSDWFADGTGSTHFYNNQSNETYAHDEFAYKSEFGFTITHDADDATVFVGTTTLNKTAGHEDGNAIAKIKDGAPYIASGTGPLGAAGALKTDILKGLTLTTAQGNAVSSFAESLHHVVFEDDSVITSPQKASGDDIIYNYGGARIIKAPSGSTILYKSGSIVDDFHIAGCFPNVDDTNLGNEIEAISYIGANGDGDNVDVTIFANSLTRKAHQQDDTLYATNTIFLKSAKTKWTELSGVSDTPTYGELENSLDEAKAAVEEAIEAKDKAEADKAAAEKAASDAQKAATAADAAKKAAQDQLKTANDNLKTADDNLKAAQAALKAAQDKVAAAEKAAKDKAAQDKFAKTVPKASAKIFAVGKKKATVSFKTVKGSSGATKYTVRYKVKGTSKWITKSAKKNKISLTKLKAGKAYEFQISYTKKVASKSITTQWSKTYTSKKIKK
jgi:hypothetical protein